MAAAIGVIVYGRNSGPSRADDHQVAANIAFAMLSIPSVFGCVGNSRWGVYIARAGFVFWWGGLVALGVGVLLYDTNFWHGRGVAIVAGGLYLFVLVFFILVGNDPKP